MICLLQITYLSDTNRDGVEKEMKRPFSDRFSNMSDCRKGIG